MYEELKSKGYTLCSYIESDGTQYIDTEYKPNNNTRAVLDIYLPTQSSYPVPIFGGRNGSESSDASFVMWAISSTSFRTDFNTNNLNVAVSPVGRFLIDKDKAVTSVNGTTYTNTSSTFQSNYNFGLFGQIDVDGVDTRKAKMRLYSCQIYDNDVLVRDFVPVEFNRQYGLWDKVNGVFYPSASDTAFTGKWAEDKELKVSPQEFRMRLMPKNSTGLPNGYYLCEYIESDGTQYIDTGFKSTKDTKVCIDIDFLNTNGTYNCVFGASQNGSTNQFVVYRTSDTTMTGQWNMSATWNITVDSVYGRRYCELSYEGFVFGESSTDGVEPVYADYSYPLHICAMNNQGTATLFAKQRVYSYQIYDNGTLIQDCVPCVTIDGIFGMYDKVTNGFYKSASSTGFTGKVVLPDGYEWLEYVYGDGNAYLDTGFKPNQDTRVVMDAQFVNASNQSAMYCIFGCRGNSKFYEIYKASASNWNMTYLYGSVYNQYFTIDYTKRHLVDYNKNTASIDGTSLTYTATTFQMDYNLFLAADNESGSVKACSPMRIYYCEIFDNGTFVRFYIPCRNPSGVYGLYDMVNGTFHASNGTSEFTDDPRGIYTINLNGEWKKSSVANPDSSLYDGVYESFSNHNIASGVATCIITITGYTQFTIHIRSDAESSYDYTIAYDLDSSSTEKATTRGNQNSGTSIGSYTVVNYTGIDGGTHTIRVSYKKDSSVNSGADRGYLIIPYQ